MGVLALAVGLAFFGEVIVEGGVYYPGDAARLYLPQRAILKQALAEGTLPWWTPDLGAGYPLLAEGEVGALYPLNWLTVGLFSLATGLNVSIVLHYIIAACGAFVFVRRLGVGRGVALFGALSTILGGFYVAHLSHLSILHAAAWFPWLLVLTDAMLHPAARGRRLLLLQAALAVVTALQFLAGHAQVSLLCLLFCGAYAAWLGLVERRTRGRWELWPAWLGALAIGAALALPQLLASAQLTAESQRGAGLSGEYFTSYSFHPLLLVTMLSPFARGNPYPDGSVEVMAYVGILPLLLAGVGLVRGRRTSRWFFAAMALVGLGLAFGRWNPLYATLERVPLLNLFRVPARYLLWTDVGIVALAVLGLEYLLGKAATRDDGWVQWGVAGAVGTGVLLTIGLSTALRGQTERLLMLWSWLPILNALLAVATWFLLSHWRPRPALAVALLVLLADLYAYGAVLDGTFSATWPRELVEAVPASVGVLRGHSTMQRVYTKEEILPALSVQRESLYPSVAMEYGLPGANVYVPLVPRTYAQYVGALTPAALDRLNVGYYMIPQLLPVDEQSELYDVTDPFAALPVDEWITFEPVDASRLVVESFLSHAADLPDGTLVAEVVLREASGQELALPLQAGVHTAEWAYERSDVRATVAHSRPQVASEWPARSGFPAEDHVGATYRASYALPEGTRVRAILLRLHRPEAYVRIERVRLVGEGGTETLLSHLAGQADHEVVYRSEDVLIYRNLDVWPRAYALRDGQASLQEGTLRLDADLTAEDLAPVIVERYSPMRIDLQVAMAQDGYLVLADQTYPGWRATVDGARTPILPVDGVFRGVQVPAGSHTVTFRYLPLHPW